jgi:hypothetical protein
MEKSNFALRVLPSLLKAAQRVAERENCSVNQLINVALAEKISVLESEYWKERRKAAVKAAKSGVVRRIAGNETPRNGDELPKKMGRRRSPGGHKTLIAGGR